MSKDFLGDKELARTLIIEIEKIEKITERCANLIAKEGEFEQKKYFVKAFLSAYALICSEVEIPIYSSFPELDRDKS